MDRCLVWHSSPWSRYWIIASRCWGRFCKIQVPIKRRMPSARMHGAGKGRRLKDDLRTFKKKFGGHNCLTYFYNSQPILQSCSFFSPFYNSIARRPVLGAADERPPNPLPGSLTYQEENQDLEEEKVVAILVQQQRQLRGCRKSQIKVRDSAWDNPETCNTGAVLRPLRVGKSQWKPM